LRSHIEKLGKRPLEQSGKHRVNKNDEGIFWRGVDSISAAVRGSVVASFPVIASKATQSTLSLRHNGLLRCARNDEGLSSFTVMAGLVPAIHVFSLTKL
jgi:hypothetical protein